MTNKEELENKKSALELLQNEAHDKLTDYKVQISLLDKELADLGKPEITPVMLDNVFEAVEGGINEFDWNDTDNFEIEYGVDYDGRINCESHELRNSDDLAQMICDKISMLFREADCPEDDNS